MRHIYSVYGMSCNNCRAHVEEALKKIDGVTGVSVDLQKAKAVIEMESHIQVEKFQEELYQASKPAASRDFDHIRQFAESIGHTGKIERWDWAYFSEKLKKKLFDIDDEILKPYFSLEKVEAAILNLATTLYGIAFIRNYTIPVYNPEVKTFEVYDHYNSFLSILYLDYHPRPGKNG